MKSTCGRIVAYVSSISAKNESLLVTELIVDDNEESEIEHVLAGSKHQKPLIFLHSSLLVQSLQTICVFLLS